MIQSEFQKNINQTKNLKLEIDSLKLKLSLKDELIEKKINSLKKDLKITLENNDLNNLEIRKLKLYNFLFKVVGGLSILTNFYFISRKL